MVNGSLDVHLILGIFRPAAGCCLEEAERGGHEGTDDGILAFFMCMIPPGSNQPVLLSECPLCMSLLRLYV